VQGAPVVLSHDLHWSRLKVSLPPTKMASGGSQWPFMILFLADDVRCLIDCVINSCFNHLAGANRCGWQRDKE